MTGWAHSDTIVETDWSRPWVECKIQRRRKFNNPTGQGMNALDGTEYKTKKGLIAYRDLYTAQYKNKQNAVYVSQKSVLEFGQGHISSCGNTYNIIISQKLFFL